MHDSASAVSDLSIRWLSAQSAPPLVLPATQYALDEAVPAQDFGGDGSIELLRLNLGMSLTWSAHGLPKRENGAVPLAHVSAKTTEPVLVIHSIHAGRVEMYDRSRKTELPIEPGLALFEHRNDIDFKLLLKGSPDIELTTFIVGESALSKILGDGVARTFLEAAKLAELPSSHTVPIPRHITGVLQSSLPPGLNNDLRQLFAQARALEYLCLLAVHVTGDASISGASQRERQIQQLYEELLAMDGKLPPLFELAERYDMSVKTMNDNFKRMFGQTIGVFMASTRLSEAHVALEESNIPMKVLAAKSGYSHVNNFINAFKKKFGYPPGSVRNQITTQQPLRKAAGSDF